MKDKYQIKRSSLLLFSISTSEPFWDFVHVLLLKASYELKELVRKTAIEQFNEDMKKQEKAEELNDSSFWKLTGSLLNKFSYPTAVNREPTDEELLQKLDKIDLIMHAMMTTTMN